MNELETNIGQISFSSKKLSKSYISVFSEKIAGNGAELFAVIEFPNKTEGSGSWADYDKVTKIVTAALRVNFRYASADSFENFLAQANAELGTIAAQGDALWLGNINAVVSAKIGADLYCGTVGKIHAYLFRQRQFSNIANSAKKLNLAKIFENFVVGRLAKKDVVVLSTAELTNLISLDRLQQELSSPNIEESTRLIADLLQDSGEKDLSVGTIFLAIGQERVSAEQALTSIERETSLSRSKRILSGLESSAAIAVKATASAAVQLGNKIRETDLRPATLKARGMELTARTSNMVDPEKFRALPRTKKFFISMAALFIVLVVADIIVATHLHRVRNAEAKNQAAFAAIRQDITQANGAQTYSDSTQAHALLADAESRYKALPASAVSSTDGKTLGQQLQALDDAINKVSRLQSSSLTDFNAPIDRMLEINGSIYAFNYSAGTESSYALSSHTAGTPLTLGFANVSAAAATEQGSIILKNQSGALASFDPAAKVSTPQKATLPAGTIGLSTYASNPVKVYAILNTASGGIVSTYVNTTSYARTAGDFSTALDIATGSSGAYALLSHTILKFASGQPRDFQNPGVTFSAGSKLFLSATRVYVLDPNAKKIIAYDTTGNLVAQYESDGLTNPKDFAVDEANKVIYVLNGTQLIALPLS